MPKGVVSPETYISSETNYGWYLTKTYTLCDPYIYDLEKTGSGTATNKALELARTHVFTVKREGPKAKKFAVLLTDGKSLWPEKTKEEAAKLRQSGVTIFAVGVGKVKIEELEDVASKPASDYNIQVDKFDELANKLTDMVRTTCKGKGETDESEETDGENHHTNPVLKGPKANGSRHTCRPTSTRTLTTDETCTVKDPADVMFLVQIPKDDNDYDVVLKYMIDMINHLDIGEGKLRVAVTLFAKNTFSIDTLPESASKQVIISALNDFQLPSKRRPDLQNAFSILDVMSELGWRRNIARILVTVFFDEPEKSLKPDILETIKGIRKRHLQSVVVNVGKPWEEGTVTLADERKDAIFVPRLDALQNTLVPVATRICHATDMN